MCQEIKTKSRSKNKKRPGEIKKIRPAESGLPKFRLEVLQLHLQDVKIGIKELLVRFKSLR